MYYAKRDIPDEMWFEIKLIKDDIHFKRLNASVVIGMSDFIPSKPLTNKPLIIAEKYWMIIERYSGENKNIPSIFGLCGHHIAPILEQELILIKTGKTPRLNEKGEFIF